MTATRRHVLASVPALSLMGQVRSSEREPTLAHVLPTASHDSLLMKVSLTERPSAPLFARIDGSETAAEPLDADLFHWRVLARGLRPDHDHRLELRAGSRALAEPWSLRTLPAPGSTPARCRLLAFSCAGGWEDSKGPGGIESFRPLVVRRRLLARALTFAPDAVFVNGDHIYWDQRSWLEHRNAEIRRLTVEAYDRIGRFDLDSEMTQGINDRLIKFIGRTQIADLYGTMLRSVPTWFIPDDHDYFENDEAEERFVTFPPDPFQAQAFRAIGRLFYPEFLPDPERPTNLPGGEWAGASALSTSFGTFRFGDLLQVLLYDCAGHLTLKDEAAGLVPEAVERWLVRRSRDSSPRQSIHMPSFPVGWTAGKWREWYPDVVGPDAADAASTVVRTHQGGSGRLGIDQPKYLWQPGWWNQHQRLVEAMTSDPRRAAVVASGDIHAIGRTRIDRSGAMSLETNPVEALLVGPLGSSRAGWPSFARGTAPATPHALRASLSEPALERNGFTLMDVESDRITVRQFAWREPQPVEAIDTLEPFQTFEIGR